MKAVKAGATLLPAEDLKKLQKMHNDFTTAKISLGDLELQKVSILRNVDTIKAAFAEFEKGLVQQYGENAVINVQTGEITYKSTTNDSL